MNRFRNGTRSSGLPTTIIPNRRTTARMTTKTGITRKNSVRRIMHLVGHAAEIAARRRR